MTIDEANKGLSMIVGEGLPFIKEYVAALNQALAAQDSNNQLTKLQQYWISFVILGILVTNSLCWSKFERFSLQGYKTSALSWMFRRATIPWNWLLTASVMLIVNKYGIKKGVLVVDDSDHARSKNTTEIAKAHKIKDKKTGGFFNGQCIVFLLLVSDKITLPVGFNFFQPDPAMTEWRKQDKALSKKKIEKKYRPSKPEQNPDFPSKLKIALGLMISFKKYFENIKITAVNVDALYCTKSFIEEAQQITGQTQVVTQIKQNQLINVNGRYIQAQEFFKNYHGKTIDLNLRGHNKKITYCSAKFKIKSLGKKYYVIALKYDNEQNYRYIIASDMTWQDIDIIKSYSFRWLVEVFIQDWKSYEGWGQLAKQRGIEGADRGLTLSLLCDHALLLHQEQQISFKNNDPAATVGSLRERVMMESITSFIEVIVTSDDPKAVFSEYADKISTLFGLRNSIKHMGDVDMDSLEPLAA